MPAFHINLPIELTYEERVLIVKYEQFKKNKKRINTLKKKKQQGLKFIGFVAKHPSEVPKIEKIIPSNQNDRKFKRIGHKGSDKHDPEFKSYEEKIDEIPSKGLSNKKLKRKIPTEWMMENFDREGKEEAGGKKAKGEKREAVVYDDFELFD